MLRMKMWKIKIKIILICLALYFIGYPLARGMNFIIVRELGVPKTKRIVPGWDNRRNFKGKCRDIIVPFIFTLYKPLIYIEYHSR